MGGQATSQDTWASCKVHPFRMQQMGGRGPIPASVPGHIPGAYAVAGAQLGGGPAMTVQLPVELEAPPEFNLAGRVKGPGTKPCTLCSEIHVSKTFSCSFCSALQPTTLIRRVCFHSDQLSASQAMNPACELATGYSPVIIGYSPLAASSETCPLYSRLRDVVA